ncbi:CotH kinase family protein [bacterium]|nr:CotH kinase family protein [bacterium]
MKKVIFCLFLLFAVFITGCGDKKAENNTDVRDDSSDTINDSDISWDYDAVTDDDIATDTGIATDEDASDNENVATDEDITKDEDASEDEDLTAESDQTTDDDTVADEDTVADFDSTADADILSDDADYEDIQADDDPATDEDGINDSGCNLNNTIRFTKQPAKMNIAPNGRSVSLVCEAKLTGCEITYQWYETPDNSTNSGIAIPDATNQTFETPVVTEQGIYHYYCAVTAATPTGESKTSVSRIANVAYTALPTLYINTPDGVEITSKEEWITGASISIAGADNESWNFDEIETSIKGRGNSSWKRPKKPYALKLKKSREIMGMPKHKRWVLLANYWDSSFMRNELAFYFSRLFELDWTVHGEFVDLVLNGKYNGLYWLGEAIKVDKNRVNINDGNPEMTDEEDKDYLIEIDTYFDETLKFKSEIREFPYMIKNDDYMVDENDEITSGGQARIERLQSKINDLEKLLYPDFTALLDTNDCSAPDESYSDIIDIDSWVKFWFVIEIMDNWDSGHPRSDFFTFDSANNIFKAGPVWDLDLAASNTSTSCRLNEALYYNALFKSPAFIARTKELWNEYSGRIDFEPEIETVRSRIAVAAKYDAMLWVGHHDYINTVLNNKTVKVFDEYVEYLKRNINKKIPVVDSFIGDLPASETNP